MSDPDRLSPRRRALSDIGIILAAVVLAALAWTAAVLAVDAQRWEELRETRAEAANIAIDYAGQLHRELLSIGEVLNILELEWERDPARFDLAQWERQLLANPAAVSQTFMLDQQGKVVASTSRDQLGLQLGDRPYFRALLGANSGRPYVGAPARGSARGEWVIDIARRLNDPQHGFAGAIVVSYKLEALAQLLGGTDLGRSDEAMVVGTDAILRAQLAPDPRPPGGSIAGSALLAAVRAGAADWRGPSPLDGRMRTFVLRRVPETDITVLVGLDEEAALARSDGWRLEAYGFAMLITALLVIMAAGLMRALRQGQGREAGLAYDRAVLARANAELEVARGRADAKSAQLGGTIAGMSDGIMLLDAELRLVQWNDRFPEFSGVPREMLQVGLPMEEILRAQARGGEFGPFADEVAIETEVSRRMAALRAGSRVGVMERERPGGRMLELRRSALPGGGLVTLYTDITARKEVEVAHRRARQVAEAATEEKSRFVAIVSHEIRTPLNVTLNALGLLEQSALDPDQRRLTGMALAAGDALRALLTDILDLSRMEVGRLALHRAECALIPLLENVVGMFRSAAAARNLELGLVIGPCVPDRLVTDASRLRQVLMNLISNTTKFAQPGLATLIAEIEVEHGRNVLRLAIRDSGPEISAADRDRLFRPFSQLSGGQAAGGAGLGLAICQVLAGLLGGRIGCDAVEEGGKEFWITLPLDQAAEPQEPESPSAPRSVLGRRARGRVLLAEDVAASRMIIATLLRREGHAVELAHDGAEAIRLATARPFDVILMDVHMPVVNGLEAARRIRGLPGPARAMPIIALTANASAEDRQACLDSGMDDVLAKPAERAVLIETVDRVLRGDPPRMAVAAAAPEPVRSELVRSEPVRSEPVRSGAARPAARVAAASIDELDLARIGRLRNELPPGLFGELAESCLDDLRSRLPALHVALAGRDQNGVVAVTHAMAGAAEGYGMREFGLRLRRVLDAARAGELDLAATEGADMDAAFVAAEYAMRALLTPETV